jgi:D-alanyl-D-alanine carboxypeptidase (penicillin-binding protein 5/6)
MKNTRISAFFTLVAIFLSFSFIFSSSEGFANTDSKKTQVKKKSSTKSNASSQKNIQKKAVKTSGKKTARTAKSKSQGGLFPSSKYASLIVDADNGSVLYSANADKIRHPASLTKLMTIYLTFESLKKNKLDFNDILVTSVRASAQPRMGLGLKMGQRITVKQALDSLVVVSANDAAVALAERIGGSEANFARIMTERAKQLGMKDTVFLNASGLPNPAQVTTAKDMAKLMMALKRDFPRYYHILSETRFSYNGRDFDTHNRVVRDYKWAKAGKTGFVNASGFNLVVGAEKDNHDIVGVVLGGSTAKARDALMVSLLEKGFSKVEGQSQYRTASR